MGRRWRVMKFGGTSVSSRARWETIAEQVAAHLQEGVSPFVVCSAVSGISNQLEGLLVAALRGEHEEIVASIRARHEQLAQELGVDCEGLIGEELGSLERLATGVSLTGEVSPRLRARVMAMGELMSTKLGAEFLRVGCGLRVVWRDARQMLWTQGDGQVNPSRHYLASACVFGADEALRQELDADEAHDVVLTQGFIARDANGETVLLGRGGSDTSASYFASKIGAERLEIWTDVPGMFTSNPRVISSVRLLKQLDYEEAQELASTGAKVLHPGCLEPVRRAKIPLVIRCTQDPSMPSTVIGSEGTDTGPRVKAISSKGGLTLIRMDTVGMWQQVGFLADVFGVFKANGLSIDLVATSETNVTVSLDPIANALDDPTIEGLLKDLRKYCQAEAIRAAAAVSLVGRNIRAILHKLGPALEVFEEQNVYLVSQAASDLNLTFVVSEEQQDRLVRKLHALIFGGQEGDELLGPSWRELFEDEPGVPVEVHRRSAWWRDRREELLRLMRQREGRAAYVYSREVLEATSTRLLSLRSVDRVFYAIKANPNEEILRLLEARGLNFECVSLGELGRLLELFPGLDPKRLLFTPNFAPKGDYERGFALGATVTLDNLHPLEAWPQVFEGREVFLRLDPGVGKGHHKHVRTAGPQSKFGVAPSQLDRLMELLERSNTKVVGLHAHVGSGIRSAETWAETAVTLSEHGRRFEDLRVLNLGGGLGVPEKPGQQPLDLEAVDRLLETFKQANPQLELWMEPGRYVVAESGVLLTSVTQLKDKGARKFVGLDTGMNSLIRPALYGAWHQIVNLSKLGQPLELTADVVGPICETGDVLGYGRRLPRTEEGDVILIGTAGAYGRAMSSYYNLREPAEEVLV